MKLKEILNSKTGNIIISIILGLGLATFFRSACSEKGCVVFLAQDPKKIEKNIFKEDNNCYKYKLKQTSCETTKKKVHFA